MIDRRAWRQRDAEKRGPRDPGSGRVSSRGSLCVILQGTHNTSELHTLGRSSGSAGRQGNVMSAYSLPGSFDLFPSPAPLFSELAYAGGLRPLETQKSHALNQRSFFVVFLFRAPVHKGPEREYLL